MLQLVGQEFEFQKILTLQHEYLWADWLNSPSTPKIETLGDINNDGFADFAISSMFYNSDNPETYNPTLIYYGGTVLDTIPDLNHTPNFIPTELTVFSPFPNPFNPVTTVKYAIFSPAEINL